MRGLITKSTGLWYDVQVGEKKLTARLRGKFKREEKKITNPIAVGDKVDIEPNDQVDGEWVIVRIEERKNYVVRKSPRKKGHDHLLASNIDQGVLIVTLKMPRTSIGFIDRFLLTLEAFRIPGIIIFNKKDLYGQQDIERFNDLKVIYESVGYRVFLFSFLEDAVLCGDLFEGKRSVVVGHSGAGKSTLVNRLVSSADQAVHAVSSFANKGVHTTTFAELFFINAHAAIIDTPGIKELGLAEIQAAELSHYFPEMRKYLGKCKFQNCLHQYEPKCAVKESVGKDVSEQRYESYLSILLQKENRR